MVLVIWTGTKSLEEVDRPEEALRAKAMAVAVTIAETTQSQINIHSKEK